MELKQHFIHRKYHKCEAKNQITIGDDYSVPDGKPDIAGILQKKAELQVDEVHTEKGKIRVQGILKLWVLYLAERSSKAMDLLEVEFPFDEILYMDGAESGDNLKIDWSIEELRINIVHPGKISVRALVSLFAQIMGTESHLVAEDMEEQENIYCKTDAYTFAEPVFERNDSYRIRDEVSLPANKPNVQNVLWQDLQMRGLDLRIQEGKIAIKGEVLLFAVYEGEDESSSIQWLEQTVPFHGSLEVTGLTGEMFGALESEIAHSLVEVKPDYDGEMRMFQVELLLNIHMHIYEERSCNVLKDTYSTKQQLIPQKEKICYEKLRMCNQAKCRVNGKEKIDADLKILQILGQQAKLQGKRSKMTDQGILCEGMLEVQILFVTANDRQPFGSANISIPYSQLIEIPDIRKEDTWKVCETIDQIFITMPDSVSMEVRSTINLTACVMQQCEIENITAVTEENYDMEAYKNLPGMMIHFVQPQETLWSIAKENRITMEEIKKLNDLPLDEVTTGQKLLLMKANMENIFL